MARDYSKIFTWVVDVTHLNPIQSMISRIHTWSQVRYSEDHSTGKHGGDIFLMWLPWERYFNGLTISRLVIPVACPDYPSVAGTTSP